MNLTIEELNELIYCVGTALKKGEMVNTPVAEKLYNKLADDIERGVILEIEDIEKRLLLR